MLYVRPKRKVTQIEQNSARIAVSRDDSQDLPKCGLFVNNGTGRVSAYEPDLIYCLPLYTPL